MYNLISKRMLKRAEAKCKAKRSYPTQERAEFYAFMRMSDMSRVGNQTKLTAYKCPICGSWHLTKSDQAFTFTPKGP